MRYLPGLADVVFPTLDATTVAPSLNTNGTTDSGLLATEASLGQSLPMGPTPNVDDAMRGTSSTV